MNYQVAAYSFWRMLWNKFRRHPLGLAALYVTLAFVLTAVYAPFFASSKPLLVVYEGQLYFPLFRYLFYQGFYTKPLDLFFNLLIFTLPSGFLLWKRLKSRPIKRKKALAGLILLQFLLFGALLLRPPSDPEADVQQLESRIAATKEKPLPDWQRDLNYLNPYTKLNLILNYHLQKEQQLRLAAYIPEGKTDQLPTLWGMGLRHRKEVAADLQLQLDSGRLSPSQQEALQAKLNYLLQREAWLAKGSSQFSYLLMPLIRAFHWEDDAGGGQSLNHYIPWWELSRLNHKDLLAALIFGTRISLVVGILAVAIALAIALPVGALAGFYGGTIDIIVCRLLEIWESMPTFFMLLMIVAISGSKSIFLVIAAIGLFSWPAFSRYLRGEFLKQRHLPYIEACHALGYRHSYIMFVHILPNAIPPLITLLPFAMMGAISSEAGLSFLGLGEEGSCSWGVLMEEGRSAFPGESYLLWPPAMMLTTLLIAIALAGDALRDALDPRG